MGRSDKGKSMIPVASSWRVRFHRAGKIAARCLSVLIEEVKQRITHIVMKTTDVVVGVIRGLNLKECLPNLQKREVYYEGKKIRWPEPSSAGDLE